MLLKGVHIIETPVRTHLPQNVSKHLTLCCFFLQKLGAESARLGVAQSSTIRVMQQHTTFVFSLFGLQAHLQFILFARNTAADDFKLHEVRMQLIVALYSDNLGCCYREGQACVALYPKLRT